MNLISRLLLAGQVMLKNINKNDKQRIERVKVQLGDYFGEKEQDKILSFEVTGFHERDFSFIAFLKIKTMKTVARLVMKTINPHPINKRIIDRENQAVVEYNILKEIYSKFENIDRCSVPNPIMVIPEIDTFLMEFVEGKVLNDELKWTRYLSNKKKFAELEEYFFDIGRWLRHFQEITGIREDNSDTLTLVLERAEDRLNLIEKANHPYCRTSVVSTARLLLEDQIKRLSQTRILKCGRHSDFQPLNILVGRNGVTVIDFMGYQEDCIAVDLLKMMIYLEDEKWSLTSSFYRVKSLKERFLEGYGKIPDVPFPALVLCEAMQRIVSLWGNISSTSRHFHQYLEANYRIKKHVDWLINKQGKSTLWPN